MWKVASLRPAGGQALLPLYPGDTLTLEFLTDGRYGGVAGCNRVMGAVERLPTGGFRLGVPGITRMACPPPTHENAFAHALGQVEEGYVMGSRLVLRLRNGGEVQLVRP